MKRAPLLSVTAVLAAVGVFLFAPLDPMQTRILAITVFCIVLWIGNPVPPWFTGLLCIGLVALAFTPSIALIGFSKTATWLILFGLVVGEATRRSGLAETVQTLALDRVAAGGSARHTYWRLVGFLSLGGLAFAFVLPSVLVRVLVMAPVLAEVGSVFEDRRPRLGILFAPLFATYYGSTGILTANLPNIIIAGIVQSVADVTITWTEWFIALFPVMGAGRVILVVLVVGYLYRPSTDATVTVPDPTTQQATDARRMLVFLVAGVVFWATDAIHGLDPVFGALGVTVLALLPRVGVMEFDAVGNIDFSIVFFVGAVFAIATALTETGFTDLAARRLLHVIPADASLPLALLVVFFVTLSLVFVIEGVAVSSVLTPILASYAVTAGLPVADVAYVEAIALGTYFFPYQSMVLVVMLRQETVTARELIRITTVLSIGTILVLLPIQLGYLSLLG